MNARWPLALATGGAALLFGMASLTGAGDLPPGEYDELYRPQFHFSPAANWVNDPNGLIWHDGEYHLFFQYHPHGLTWGPMHWGHAVSADLVRWRELPIALRPDEIGAIWSGGAVFDRANSSGLLPDGGLVAIFSYQDQSQGIATSSDRGRSWTMYAGNPVIPSPGRDFRDPKVFWDVERGRWAMAIARGTRIVFFHSPDLIRWTESGAFGGGHGSIRGPWEVPDLFPLGLDGETHWVLLVSAGGAPGGGPGVQYFIGDFDGETFINSNPPATTLWLDYGPDNYAGTTWNDTPDGARVYLGWMNNWRYANEIPTSIWRGAMTLPRELHLVASEEGPRLTQQPVASIESLRGEPLSLAAGRILPGTNLLAGAQCRACELEIEIEPDEAEVVGLRLRMGADESTDLRWHAGYGLLLNRMRSGATGFSRDFPEVARAPLALRDGRLSLRVFVDWSSVEVFANDGRAVISSRIFPAAESEGLELYAEGGEARLVSLRMWPLKSIWRGADDG